MARRESKFGLRELTVTAAEADAETEAETMVATEDVAVAATEVAGLEPVMMPP